MDENGECNYVYEGGDEEEGGDAPSAIEYLDEEARAELAAHEAEDARASGIDLHRALSMLPASALVAAASAVPRGDICRPRPPPRSAMPPE
eukprot:10846948-Karenia_brevis.AAC.1